MAAVAVKVNPKPRLNYTAQKKYPSALQAKRSVMTPGGPQLRPIGAVKKTAPRVPGKKVAPTVNRNGRAYTPMFRKGKMALRVGVPKVGLRGKKVSQRLYRMGQNVAGPNAKRTVTTNKQGQKVIRTAGKTKIIGKNRVLVATKQGSVLRNKKAGTVARLKRGPNAWKLVKRYGLNTATKADDARAVKIRNQKKAVLKYTNAKGRTVRVARNLKAPGKVRVVVRNPKGEVVRKSIIGPKKTATTRGGETTIKRTRYISGERRRKVTPRVGEKGWARGNTKPAKKAPGKKTTGKTPGKKLPAKKRSDLANLRVRGNWKNIKKFRRIRRRRGARFNQSLTKGQIRKVASRSYS